MEQQFVKGYKVFNHDWTCRGYQFEVGKTFQEYIEPKCCDRGFHFCVKASDCFDYYKFDTENKVAEVLAVGAVDTNGNKSCTNKIKIVREIPWAELLEIVNTGKGCTGLCNSGNRNSGDCNSGNRNSGDWNSGNRNSGDRNSGDWNSGDWNSGNRNSGDWNSGNWNSGDRNSGDRNSGDWNSGDWNSGNWNSGDWNSGNWNNGCFNTIDSKIFMFNKQSEWTYKDWLWSDARGLMNQIPKDVVEWIYSGNMTDDEKAAHPEHETTGGYLKVLDESENAQIWWDGLSERERNIIKDLPNFDADIFSEITGIKIKEK